MQQRPQSILSLGNYAKKVQTCNTLIYEPNIHPTEFQNRGIYDLNDRSGVHINSAGSEFLGEIFADFASSVSDNEYQTPQSKKRLRSSTSTPGSEVKQQSKIPKPST